MSLKNYTGDQQLSHDRLMSQESQLLNSEGTGQYSIANSSAHKRMQASVKMRQVFWEQVEKQLKDEEDTEGLFKTD